MWNWLKNLDEEKKGRLKAIGMAIGLMLIIVLYAAEFPHFSNTFGVKRLVIGAIILGLLAGLVVALRVSLRFKEQVERIVVILLITIFTGGIMPLVASLSNRLLSFSGPYNQEVEFFKLEAYRSSRFGNLKDQIRQIDGYYLFVIYNNQLERIQMDEPRYLGTERGEKIELPLKRGFWGFEFVDFD